jgi:steroid delta-isomerase
VRDRTGLTDRTRETAMPTADAIRATIARYIEVFSAGDRAGYLDLFATDATVEDPVGSEVRVGHDGIGEFWDFVHSLSSSIELRPAGPVCLAGPGAAFPILIVNDLGGTLMGIDAIDVVTVDDDAKITSLRAYWDMADMHEI